MGAYESVEGEFGECEGWGLGGVGVAERCCLVVEGGGWRCGGGQGSGCVEEGCGGVVRGYVALSDRTLLLKIVSGFSFLLYIVRHRWLLFFSFPSGGRFL